MARPTDGNAVARPAKPAISDATFDIAVGPCYRAIYVVGGGANGTGMLNPGKGSAANPSGRAVPGWRTLFAPSG